MPGLKELNSFNNGDKPDILADTNIWIEFFKPHSETGAKLESLLLESNVWVCGIIIFELVQGIKSEKERAAVQETLSGLRYAEMSKNLWIKAGNLSAALKKKGFTIPPSDILISSIAMENGFVVFTLDNHFNLVPDLKIYK